MVEWYIQLNKFKKENYCQNIEHFIVKLIKIKIQLNSETNMHEKQN